MLRLPRMIKAPGFTLVELMIGIVILAIAMAMGASSYREWIQNTRIRTTAQSILNGLQLARAEAVKRNASVGFTLGASSSWSVACTAPFTPITCPDATALHSRAAGDGSSSSITIVAADGPTYVFNSLGRMTVPAAPAGGVTAINVDVDPSVLSAAQSRDLRVTADVGGSIRLCDPNVAATDVRRCQ